ncbi:hypothetical protein CEXT_328041 [Caerostris extrusa]|uniref:Uncharacterized protein n=1 Tax=Caerostris extrusa TaxID=172846 RepID=A0AAV4MSN8_CAEEX|nr:hypothetical protein CEXT_328041 [Caerostris extrusa]
MFCRMPFPQCLCRRLRKNSFRLRSFGINICCSSDYWDRLRTHSVRSYDKDRGISFAFRCHLSESLQERDGTRGKDSFADDDDEYVSAECLFALFQNVFVGDYARIIFAFALSELISFVLLITGADCEHILSGVMTRRGGISFVFWCHFIRIFTRKGVPKEQKETSSISLLNENTLFSQPNIFSLVVRKASPCFLQKCTLDAKAEERRIVCSSEREPLFRSTNGVTDLRWYSRKDSFADDDEYVLLNAFSPFSRMSLSAITQEFFSPSLSRNYLLFFLITGTRLRTNSVRSYDKEGGGGMSFVFWCHFARIFTRTGLTLES